MKPVLIALLVLLIILIYGFTFGFGITFTIIFSAMFFYAVILEQDRGKMVRGRGPIGEYIGGSCMEVNKYNRDNYLDENWCNLEKRETDKTNLTKRAQLKFHPDLNRSCPNDASNAFRDVNSRCGIIVEKKQKYDRETKLKEEQNNNRGFTGWSNGFFSTSDNTNTNSPPRSSTDYLDYKSKEAERYKNMSDNELRQSFYSADQSVYKEMADRNFARNNYNVKLNPDERPDTDFCSIM